MPMNPTFKSISDKPGSSNFGAALLVLSALIFTLHTVLVRQVQQVLSSWDIGFVRWVLGAFFILLFARLLGAKNIWGNNRRLLATRGIVSSMAYLCFISSLQFIPISASTVLFFTCPMFAAIFGLFINGQKIQPLDWLFVLGGFVGVTLVVQPEAGGLDLNWGHMFGISGGVLAGLSISLVRRLRNDNSSFTIYLYFCLVGAGITLLPSMGHMPEVMPAWPMLLTLLAVVLSSTTGQLLLNQGMKNTPAHTGAVLLSSQVVFTTVVGVVFLGESMTWTLVLGSILVLGCGGMLSRKKKTVPLTGPAN
jgi:drug/metabolite transporter (DMT)-like permease